MAIYKCGMTSVTFRDKTPEEIIALTKQAKLQGIEWGSDVHVPVGNLELAKEIGDKTRGDRIRSVFIRKLSHYRR